MIHRRIALLALLFLAVLAEALSAAPQTAATPEKTPQAKPAVGAAAVKLEPQMPAGAPGKPFHFPKAATKTLANGLRVFVVSSGAQPVVTVRLVLTAAGTIHDPAGKPGVANLTANLLTQGTEKRTAKQIAEAIDFVGGQLSTSADQDGTYVTATVVKKDLDLALDLLSDVALHPALRPEELDRRRQQLLSGLRVRYSDPSYLASVTFDRVVYGQHPYGLPAEGTPDSVRGIGRDDLVRFRDAHYAPGKALLVFAGDITAETAFAATEKYLGAWESKALPGAEVAAPQRPQGLRIFLIDKPDAVQSQIRVGRPGIRRNDPDYIPLYVTNRIFGGGYNSRLNTEVRQKKGLTYGASSGFSSYRLAGHFEASTFTRTETTVEASKLVMDLIAKMATGAVSAAELDFARDYLAGVFPTQSETPEQVAERVLNVAQYDLPADYNDTYQQKVRAVGPDQVAAMAARYFHAADLDLVLAGNVGAFRDALKKEFPTAKFEEIPFDQLDLLAADLRKSKETAVAATPEALARGKALLAAAAEAAGGAALARIESLELIAPGEFSSPQGPMKADVKVQVVFPDKVRVEVKTPFFTFLQGFDGKAAWAASPQGAMDLPANLNADIRRGIDLEGVVGLYQQTLAGKVEVQFLGEEELEGKKVLAAEWNSAAGKTKLFFDPATGLLVGARYRQATMQGAVETLQVWSDFRDVAGVKFPFHWLNYRDGAKYSDQTIQDVKVNTKPEPALFSKPAK
jgi:zinc protease